MAETPEDMKKEIDAEAMDGSEGFDPASEEAEYAYLGPEVQKADAAPAPDTEVDGAGSDDEQIDELESAEGPHEPEPKAVTPNEISDDLILRASDYGFSPDDANEFGTPEQLSKMLDLLDKRSDAPNTVEPDAPVREESANPDASPAQKLTNTLDPDLYDEDLIAQMDSMVESINASVVALGEREDAINSMIEEHRLKRQNEEAQTFDQMFDGESQEWQHKFGAGPTSDLRPTGAHFKNRQRVRDEMEVQRIALAERGQVLDEKALMERAVSISFNDFHQQIARKQVEKQVEDRRGQMLHRPTSATRDTTGRRATLSRIAQFMKDRGMIDGTGAPTSVSEDEIDFDG